MEVFAIGRVVRIIWVVNCDPELLGLGEEPRLAERLLLLLRDLLHARLNHLRLLLVLRGTFAAIDCVHFIEL